MKKYLVSFACLTLMLLLPAANAQRIKDLADVAGVRSNQLIGYGLVVGLPGTGEQSPFTEQSFKTMLSNFGIKMPANLKPKIKNVAAVAVHAELPAFAKPGQTIDVTVSSMGSAQSLRGGTLIQTILMGLDGNAYAVAQGSLIVSGLGAEGLDGSKVIANTPTVGRIANGAMVEREVLSPFASGDHITFNLHNADFTTAKRLSDTINNLISGSARAIDAASVQVTAPRDAADRVSFLSVLENLEFEPGSPAAKIIVNSRTGTIVIGADVRLLPAAITHGGITVTINEVAAVAQPNAFAEGVTVVTNQSIIDVKKDDSRMFVFDPGVTLDALVRAINQVGAGPGDVMAILEALDQAGALRGDLIII
ncbi:flagellar basal body P-ring protein FlgI [Colwellia sp. MB02u-18]|nr:MULTISPECIES: flagellar basal body P-ring protein FlgI [unclassified Colwellia]MBA6223197.1 flagellar basal body P-ring protein FlgI [Colwellia sp. MB3u-45]MBA6265943.1 flagellar basal body P-ring protein FlgI [Colwellia sp. MB3u-43]MBA6320252.1 flagellar basal body P-ring protein FlgI [Colwellia sp. MB02u-19]MBA6323012.1 flagellar basal body P-ring protein FlgI [Colwellia sp. MB02u-18]MBA6329701.1 flagellar basal body P-ring protein FlgI [Colwellia sp. MB02u-12]